MLLDLLCDSLVLISTLQKLLVLVPIGHDVVSSIGANSDQARLFQLIDGRVEILLVHRVL